MGQCLFVLPRAGLLILAFGPSLHTYFLHLWIVCVLTEWAEMLIVGAAGTIEL